MGKRIYPFEVGVLRQFKIHVNNIECDRATLKEIQDKTIHKLFSAQKNMILHGVSNLNSSYLNKEKNMKHMDLFNYTKSKNANSVKLGLENNVMSSSSLDNCSYCDIANDNIYYCSVCSEKFCINCSFADYSSGADDVRTCITCAS